MRRVVLLVIGVLLLLLTLAPAAQAHLTGPCADETPTGAEFAEHHIVSLATTGGLGAGGHVPGSHMGFSACL
jgi:hypothetical protein